MKRIIRVLIVGMLVFAMNTICFASALTDFQAAQAQVATLTAQVQQAAALAQVDPAQAQNYQLLQARLAQAQQQMQALQAAAAQELQQQQALAQQQQAQQAAALQAQQQQAQQAAALQAQQQQAQQAAALQAQQQQAKQAAAPSGAGGYVGNKNSKKFHVAGCSSVGNMNPGNKVMFNSRDEAISNGYVPCKICKP